MKLLVLLFLGLLACTPSTAVHKALYWDSNTEPDMAEYRVYQCPVSPCLASGPPFAKVVHGTAPSHFVSLPDSDKFYVVYAVDQSGNVSAPSVTVFANVMAPATVTGVRIQ